MYYISPIQFIIDQNLIIPTTKIILENETFKAPKEIKLFLEQKYGNLSPDAIYNEKLGIYI